MNLKKGRGERERGTERKRDRPMEDMRMFSKAETHGSSNSSDLTVHELNTLPVKAEGRGRPLTFLLETVVELV